MINPYQSPLSDQRKPEEQRKPELLPLSKYVARGAFAGAKWTAIVLVSLAFIGAIIGSIITLHISYRYNVPLSELNHDWDDVFDYLGGAIGAVFFFSIPVGSLFGLLNGLRQRRMHREG